MIATVRFIGLMNAAVWIGAAVFASLGADRVVTSDGMRELLTPKHYSYFSGVIGQMLAERYWSLHLACATIALLHLGAESLYFGKAIRKVWLGLLLGLLLLGVSEKFGIQPAMKRLHLAANAVNRGADERRAATASYRNWSNLSGTFEFMMIFALGTYLWKVANPPDATRFLSTGKYRG